MTRNVAGLTLGACLIAGTALAQDFSESSFGEGSFDTPAPAQGSQPSGSGMEDGFAEGSFDNPAPAPVAGIPAAPPPVPGAAVVPAPPDGGLPEVPVAGALPPPPPGETSDPPASGAGSVLPPAPGATDGGQETAGDEGVLPDAPDTSVVAAPEPEDPRPDVKGPGVQVDPRIAAFETRDFGVPPQNDLRQGQLHAPTPVSVPGAQLVTTAALVSALESGAEVIMIDVLGGNYTLPNAYTAPALASAGSFNDRTQQQAVGWLQQITRGNPGVPIVIFCSDPMCWLSYNATLRTVAAGFNNVYWYRGGLQAWQMAGLPLRPAGF